jgi:para-aminobenzoate synthetase
VRKCDAGILEEHYSPLHGTNHAHMSACCAVPPIVLRNDEVNWEQLRRLLAAGEVDNVVISPGPGTPTCAADIGRTAGWTLLC